MVGSLIAVSTAGCGGGGGDGDGDKLVLTGTVAIGKSVGNTIVSAQCGGLSAKSPPTNAAGEYRMEVLSLPCILQATTSDGTILRSMASSSGVVNITPITELITAQSALDFSRLPDAKKSVANYLGLMGVDGGLLTV